MRLTIALITAALAVSISACGGDDDDNSNGGGQGNSSGQSGGAGKGGNASCDMNACLGCLTGGGGTNCLMACAGCEDDESGDGGDGGDNGGQAGGGASQLPDKECVSDDECGVSFECVSCGLTDGEGWCEQTKACKFDDDCGIDGKCGYNVKSGEYRCLPEDYCP